ncbi:response regulator transcription factor [Nocardioides sp. AE5]|uniref:response regulator transcription factor n=1 Tax=Nocardioides sp. AE5 TaxID=2962573 RepID=UPI0028810C7A|nr:response regulator transcription factor [Nocardioides sp. AE5]MDT0202616.1 response regulator transcription factor [Nocardioides sp. AE5]
MSASSLGPEHAVEELPSVWRSCLRDAYADLRALAAETSDPVAGRRALAVAARLRGQASDPLRGVHLTNRELDVLTLLGSGLPNRQIAARLCISLHTVKSHVQNIMLKLHATTRFEAVVQARRCGLLP